MTIKTAFAFALLGLAACGSTAGDAGDTGETTGKSAQALTSPIPVLPPVNLPNLYPNCPLAWDFGVGFVATKTWSCPTETVVVSSSEVAAPVLATLSGTEGPEWLADEIAPQFLSQFIASNPYLTPAMLSGDQPWCAYTFLMNGTASDWNTEAAELPSQLQHVPGAETVEPLCWVPPSVLPVRPPCTTCNVLK